MCAEVLFRHFWPGHDTTKVFLANLISPCIPDPRTNVWVTSVFPANPTQRYFYQSIRPLLPNTTKTVVDLKLNYRHYPPLQKESVYNVWFTGENCRPPESEGWHAFLSFDLDSLGGVNHYLPLWITRLGSNASEVMEVQRRYLEHRSPQHRREKFACAFIGNPEPSRMRFLRELNKIGQVDVFGKAVGKPIRNKLEVMKSYTFNLCFENDLYPGYVTEKPLEALGSGCIPIWSGLDAYGSLNEEAIVNLAESNQSETLDRIADLFKDESLIALITSKSILKKTLDIHQIQNSLVERFRIH